MILTKNKLKNRKVKLDDDDDEFNYMNFLRFKHLIDRRERQRNRNNKATQTEQERTETNNDKATNTVDELLEPFRLKMRSDNHDNNQKATQTTARRDQETSPRFDVNFKDYILKGSDRSFSSWLKGKRLKDRRDMMTQVYLEKLRDESTPPDTDDDDDEYKPSVVLEALGLATNVALYGTGLGVRLGLGATQMLLEGAFNLYDAMQSEQQEEANETEVIEVASSPPISVNSSPPITVDSSPLPTPTQIPTPTSPRSSNESVILPKKKSK